jgi:hypothetical protein
VNPPQFGEPVGTWHTPRLDGRRAQALRSLLEEDRKNWSEDRAAAFLVATASIVSMEAAEVAPPTLGETKQALAKLEEAVESMQTALMALTEGSELFLALQNHWDLLRLQYDTAIDVAEILDIQLPRRPRASSHVVRYRDTRPPPAPRDAFLASAIPDAAALCDRAWRDLEALRHAAAFAGERMKAPQELKPAAMRAKAVVTRIADRYRAIYGCWPPTSRSSWFAAYMLEVGGAIGVPCTESLTATAMTELRAAGRTDGDGAT